MKSQQTIPLLLTPLLVVSAWGHQVQSQATSSLNEDGVAIVAVNAESDAKAESTEKQERPRRPLLREMEARRGAEPSEGEREGRDGRGPRELSQEQINAALEILREQNPELARRMSEALEQRPELAQRLIANHWPRLERLIELKKNNPKLFRLTMDEFRLQRQLFDSARKLRQTKEAGEKDGLRQQMREQVGKLFDLRMKIKEAEVDALEKRLTEMRDQIKQARGERENRIAEQLKDLEEGKPPMPPAPPPYREPQRQDKP